MKLIANVISSFLFFEENIHSNLLHIEVTTSAAKRNGRHIHCDALHLKW